MDFIFCKLKKLIGELIVEAEREAPAIVKSRLRPLTEDEEDQVHLLMSSPGGEEIAKEFNQTILAAHLICLAPGTWLNDEVMNFYFNLIMKRSKAQCEKGEALRCWCFNTFFLEKLTKGYVTYDYKPVRRWTKSKKVTRNEYEVESPSVYPEMLLSNVKIYQIS